MLESINENSDESIQIDKICSLSVEVISGLLDAVCILWRSIKVDLDKVGGEFVIVTVEDDCQGCKLFS